MNTLDITIATWMSYEPVDKKYYFGIGFDGIDDMESSLERDFANDMYEATSIISKFDMDKELPESGYHRYVLKNINKNIQMTIEQNQSKYSFGNIIYDMEMKLLIEGEGNY